MTTRGEINSNFYQIVNVDANGAPTSVKPEYLPNVGNANYAANAGHAVVADTANLVLVANVSGIGNIATINLSGNGSQVLLGNGTWGAGGGGNAANANYANFAGTAFNVNGSNVTGVVPNATHAVNATTANTATVANSVAVANVVGIGNIATLNLTGSSSNVLYGNGVFAAVSNGANANFANFAGTAFSVSAGNIVGTVNLANFATVANSVVGSNVSGDVSGANHANISDVANLVAGANVTGTVGNATHATISDSANSVAGANVTGTVSLATHANIADVANLVAGANVSGTVANATHATVADSANSVAGANVTGQVGNALVSGTVYSNSQPNITSVGTLSNLTVTGNIQSFADISGAYIYGNGAFLTGVGNLSAARGYWGSFFSNVTQTIASTTTAYPITLNNTDPDSYGIYISSNSHINFTYAGNYNVQFSSQFVNPTASPIEVDIWIRINGVDVPESRGVGFVVDKQGSVSGQAIISWNYILPLNAADYVQFMWHSESTSLTMENIPAGTTPTTPSAPSIIITAQQVTNVQPVELQGAMTGNITGNGFSLINIASISSLDGITGNTFTGNGAPLTNLTGANVVGNVGNSVHSYFADLANSIAGANVSGQVANSLVAGTVYTNAQPNITSVGTLTSVSSSGNITAPRFISNIATGTAPFIVTSTTQVANLSVATAGSASVASTVLGNAQPNITSLGTLSSLNVTGNIVTGNAYANSGTITAKYFTVATGGNITTLGQINSTVATGTAPFTVTSTTQVANLSVATANLSNFAITSATAGTVTTNAQPNITSVGTLTSLSVTGNLTSGNASLGNLAVANFFQGDGGLLSNITFTGNVSNANYASYAGNVVNASQPNITTVGTLLDLNVSGNIFTNTAAYIGNTSNATGLTNPTLVAKASGATYVQGALINGSPAGSADWVSYGDNGSDSGAWADMGFTGSGFSDPLYTLTGINDGYFIVQGDDSSVYGGNLVIATGQQGSTKDIVFGTGGFLAADEKMRFIHATGQFYIQPTTVSTDTTTGALRVAGGVGIGGDVFAGNTVNANYFVGNGSLLTGIVATDAAHANIADVANSVAGANVSGSVANATYANISGVAYSVNVGNVSGIGNIATVNLDGNLSNILYGNGVFAAAPSVSNVANANFANFAGTAFSVAGGNVTGTVGNSVHSDFADVANLVAGINVTGTVANATYAITAGSATVAATVTTNAQPNITSVGSLTGLTVTGNISAGNINGGNLVLGNFFSGNGHYLTDLTGANVTGTVANATYALSTNTSNTAITVTGGAQPNIVSVGTLTSLSVTGNVSANYYIGNGSALTGVTATATPGGANTNIQFNNSGSMGGISTVTWNGSDLSLGAISNVKITGGTTGQVISTDGAGNLSFVAQSGGGGSSGFENVFLMMGA